MGKKPVLRKTTGPDYLSQLPNLRDYERAAYRLNSDNYSAMGALVLDVPDFFLFKTVPGVLNMAGRFWLIFVENDRQYFWP